MGDFLPGVEAVFPRAANGSRTRCWVSGHQFTERLITSGNPIRKVVPMQRHAGVGTTLCDISARQLTWRGLSLAGRRGFAQIRGAARSTDERRHSAMNRPRSNGRRTASREVGLMLLAVLAGAACGGCSIKKFAINKLGDSLANSGTTFASDNDPEFVGQAVPFSLKLIEGLIAESPKHRGLLFAASRGFTEYSYVYVQEPAEEIEDRDLEQSNVLRGRARKLYLRARDYGMQGL